jgi:hypothetical protein
VGDSMNVRRFTGLIAALVLIVASTAVGPPSARALSDQNRSNFFELTPVAHDVGPSIATAPRSDHARRPEEVIPLLQPGGGGGGGGAGPTVDGAVQTSATPALGGTVGVNVDGVGVGITPLYSDCCTPPDTNLAVGTSQVVQWVNLDFAAFDKSGLLIPGYPKAGNSIWAGFGGKCETNNSGDPIVKFDAQAGRWFMTQFAVSSKPYLQCFAVSNTATFTTTTWNRYAFSFGSDFPDYPKVGVWAGGPLGGAYFMSFNLFKGGAAFGGAAACAFDRGAMLGGFSATGQCFNLGRSVASLLPGDLDGFNGATGTTAAPPDATTDVFANFGTNVLNLWKMHVDFGTSANTTITKLPSLATAAFATACGGGACIPQAGNTSQKLDSLGDRLMYRLAYRNFGDHESLVVNHSVAGSGTAAPRWYELRTGVGSSSTVDGQSAVGSFDYRIYQQSTYAPDATYRWMGSAAQNKLGDLAIGYSASSSLISPQIRYTGRVAGDTLGQLRDEATVALGTTGSNTGPYSRWGDYSSMVTDPADDCTFWYTNQYLKQNGGSFTWSTRIVSFKFSAC